MRSAAAPAILFGFLAAAALAANDTAPASSPADAPKLQCGHHAILHCCHILGVPLDARRVMALLPPRADGHSMLELIEALETLGLKAEGRQETYGLLRKGDFPVIAHMHDSHFVVVERANSEFVMLLDGYGRRKMLAAGPFQKDWDGKLLRVTRPDPARALPDCPPAGDSPRIQFDKLFIDKGEIPFSPETIAYQFFFRNAGRANLLIKDVRTTCSCLSAVKPEQAIAPGESAALILRYSSGQQGAFMQTAIVETNDPCTPEVELAAAGNTSRSLIIDPPLLDFHRVVAGRSKSIFCIIRYLGDTPLEVRNIACALPGLALKSHVLTKQKIDELKTRGVGTRNLAPGTVMLEADLAAPATEMTIDGKVSMTTNIPGFNAVEVAVKAQVVAPAFLSPSILFFGEITPESKLDRTVTVLAREGERINVVDTDAHALGLDCVCPIGPAHEQVELSFTGTGAGLKYGPDRVIHVVIQTLAGRRFNLSLPVYALLAQAGHE